MLLIKQKLTLKCEYLEHNKTHLPPHMFKEHSVIHDLVPCTSNGYQNVDDRRRTSTMSNVCYSVTLLCTYYSSKRAANCHFKTNLVPYIEPLYHRRSVQKRVSSKSYWRNKKYKHDKCICSNLQGIYVVKSSKNDTNLLARMAIKTCVY